MMINRGTSPIFRISALRWFYQREFAKSLAAGDEKYECSAVGLWALYKMGLYQRVLKHPVPLSSVKGQFARIVSLTACAEIDQAELEARRFLESGVSGKQAAALIQAVSRFSAVMGERLLSVTKVAETSPLPVALAIRLGQLELARERLEHLEATSENLPADVRLMRSNLFADTPEAQLLAMNDFFADHGLSGICARDITRPMGVMNLHAPPSIEQWAIDSASQPLVSVLMTTYCSGPRAVCAIESLLNQTHVNLQVIVVDDASPDDTFEQVQACAADDSRVLCLQLPCNAGTYAAKTFGLKYAEGDFITCHDSDDWSHPDKIKRQLAPLLKQQSLVATTSQWVRLTDEGKFYVRQAYPFKRLNSSSLLFRRRVLDDIGGWDLVRTGADSEFLARMKLFYGRRAVKWLTEPLSFGAHRNDSLMTAKYTGHGDGAVSPVRQAYWESWNDWHIRQLRQKLLPSLSNAALDNERPFSVPESIRIEQSLLDMLGIGGACGSERKIE